ncbi:MAG: sortase, partial [Actinoplanes sp.]
MTAGPHAEETPDEVVRGVAKVVKPPGVRAFARVPGALSVPWPKPRRLPQLASPSAVFPRRMHPPAPPPPQPELRPATPPGASPATATPLGAGPPADSLGDGPPSAPRGDGAPPVPGKPRKRRLRRLALPTAAALVAAFAVGTAYLSYADRPPESDVGRWAASPEAVTSANTGVERPPGDPFGSVAAAPQGVPALLRVSAIGVNTTLESLKIGADGALEPPRAFGKAGWYADGTAPGDTGPAVIAGHVDSRSGPAVFYRLRELTVGDRIEVVRGGAVVRFTVTRTA